MTALTLSLREGPHQRIDMSPLTPCRLLRLTLDDIAALELHAGNRRRRVAELFDISGCDARRLVIRNSRTGLDNIGAGMSEGELVVEGDCGNYLGQDLRGGLIEVRGNSGHWTASGMHGGMIRIAGDCGDFAAAALPGKRQGMCGGVLLVRGGLGDRAGDRMRRGYLLAQGDAGGYCGARMLAGTIAILGRVGPKPGYAMRRGTLLLSHAPADLPATFNDCGEHNLGFLPLMLRYLSTLGGRFAELDTGRQRVRRFAGDLAGDAKGEILVWVEAHAPPP